MDIFFQTILSFPTVIFTVLLAVSGVYWLFVLAGVVDLDGGDGALDGLTEGAAEGVAEGAAEGLAEGAAEGVAEGAAGGVAEGGADGVLEGGTDGAAGLISALRLRSAPVTVVFSLVVLFAWGLSYLGSRLLAGTLPIPDVITGLVVMVVALVGGLLIASVAVRPLAPLFEVHHATNNRDLIGQSCLVRSGRVDERFGQAVLSGVGAELLLDVRCDEPNRLARGTTALIIDFDDDRNAFVVTPMDPLLKLPAELGPRGEERGA